MDLTINSRVNKLANHAFECTDIIWLDTIPNYIRDIRTKIMVTSFNLVDFFFSSP
jgi:hypothetical protein